MKKFFSAILTLVCSVSLCAQNEDKVQIADFDIKPGETKTLSVELENSRAYTGFQMDVQLPEGLDVLEVSLDESRKTATHELAYNTVASGAVRVIAYSMQMSAFSGNSGALVNINVKAADNMAKGMYEIKISEIRFAESDATEHKLADCTKQIECKPITYTVTALPSENGTITGGGVYEKGQNVTLTATPNTGYEFTKWTDDTTVNPYTFTATADKEIGAVFSPQMFTVTYVIAGETVGTQEVAYGATVTPIDDPVKEGHTFAGWKDVPATMPAHDVTIEGSYTVNSYKLVFKVDGEIVSESSVAYGSAITAPKVDKEGHTFAWDVEVPKTMPAKDLTINGSYTVNVYAVNYYLDGEKYHTDNIAYGEPIVLIAEPEQREGYIFSGWSSVPATMPAHDVTVEGSFAVDGIAGVIADDALVTVNTISGKLIMKNVRYQEAVKKLAKGLYFINGKKVSIR